MGDPGARGAAALALAAALVAEPAGAWSRRPPELPPVPVDEPLIAALGHGLPDCAGVALGLDRLLMRMAGAARIEQVLAFPADRA